MPAFQCGGGGGFDGTGSGSASEAAVAAEAGTAEVCLQLLACLTAACEERSAACARAFAACGGVVVCHALLDAATRAGEAQAAVAVTEAEASLCALAAACVVNAVSACPAAVIPAVMAAWGGVGPFADVLEVVRRGGDVMPEVTLMARAELSAEAGLREARRLLL